MQKIMVVLVLLYSLVVVVYAKDKNDKERLYDAPFDKVWASCIQAANEKYTITFSNKDDGVISFEQGLSWKTNSWGMRIGVTVVALSDTQTKVTINPQKKQSQASWAGGSITRKFFASVDNALKSPEPVANAEVLPTAGSATSKAVSPRPLTNADVLKLKAAGLTEQLVIDKIKASPADYRLDTNDLVELKQAGLSDAIIGAMIQASQR